MLGVRFSRRHATSLAVSVVSFLPAVPAIAAITLSGDSQPNYTGADPWDVSGSLRIGITGTGNLNIDSGSQVEATYGYLGQNTGSNGTAIVTGVGSILAYTQFLYVGRSGTGTLNITGQGTVTNQAGTVAYSSGSSGSVVLNGSGATWINNGLLTVGGAGSGSVDVTESAMMQSNGATLGSQAGSNGTVTVSFGTAAWNNNGDLKIGQDGTGLLNITLGATVNVTQGTILDVSGGGNGTIQFNSGTLTTGGLQASPSDLSGVGVINTGTLLSDVDLVFDSVAGLQPQIVLNSLPGQNITINVDASATGGVGALGAGYKGVGTLTIADGLAVSSGEGYLGYFTASEGTATVTGPGSAWNNTGDFYVGRDGRGTLVIENGGSVSNATSYLDAKSGPSSTATITGTNSVWDIDGELYIGQEGTGKLYIESGGVVNVTYNTVAGRQDPGSGEIHFNQGTLNTGGLLASPEELLGVGTINTAGLVSDVNLRFDASTGYQTQVTLNSLPGQAIMINVDPTTSSDAILLGAGNRGVGTMAIADGLVVPSAYGILGYYAGSSGTADVSGAGTAWDNSEDMLVGLAGTGTLNIAGGATVSNAYGIVGSDPGSLGTVNLIGQGSNWVNNADLIVGLFGAGTLNITDGAVVNNRSALIAGESTSIGTVNVIGAGSTWDSTLPMVVAAHGIGTLHITQGGTVSDFGGTIGSENGSIGTVTVQGIGSSWTHAFSLTVGGAGTATLNIIDGGIVSNTSGFVGQSVGSTGTVTVTGAGSAWNNADELDVGFYGAGTLVIQSDATVSVGDGLILGRWSGSTGTVNLIGGTLDLNGTDLRQGAGVALFNFIGGTLQGAGTIELEHPFSQDGGTLAPGGSIGQTVIVGEYNLSAGTLEIELGGLGDPIDRVSVTGDIDIATLGTTLDLRALGPMAAGTYTLMESTGGTITGLFEIISPFNLFGVNVSVLNTGTAITVTLDGDLIFADPNMDGFVGLEDLNIVLGNWNQNVTPGDILAGDLNGDGFVGIEDLNAVLGSWNAGTPPPPEVLSSVPEPAGVVLMLAGVAGLSRGRCRRMA